MSSSAPPSPSEPQAGSPINGKAAPLPEPSYKRPMSWFGGEVLGRPKKSVWQSMRAKSKAVATQRGEPEDGSGVVAWDPSLAKWDWYLKARSVSLV
jgi:hypothetical protein